MKLIGSRVLINFGSKPVKTRYSVLSSKSAQNWYYSLYVCTMFLFFNCRETSPIWDYLSGWHSSAGAASPDTWDIFRTRSSSWQSWNQHKFLVFWWLWEQHTRFNTRLNIWVAIWRCVALPRPLNLQNIANLWTNGLQNCKNLGSSAIACRSHHFVGKQIC